MYKNKRRNLNAFSPVLISVLFIYIFLLSSAREGFCFNVSPQVVDVILSPEEEYRGEFDISNDGSEEIKVIISLEEFCGSDTAVGKDGEVDKKWISISPAELYVPPKESQKCRFKIKLPKEGRGEYRVYAFFQDVSQKKEGQQINIAVRFGSIICAVVKGTEIVKGEIRNIQLAGSKPGRFFVKIYNGGNVHAKPIGDLIVKNILRNDKEIIMPINTKGVSVLPATEEEYLAKGDVNLEPGIYSVIARIDYGREYEEKAIKLAKRKFFKITLK